MGVRLPKSILCLVACELVSAAALAADPTSITDPPHLWVAEASGAHLLQPADPTLDLTLPGTSGARAIGVDHTAQQAPGTGSAHLR